MHRSLRWLIVLAFAALLSGCDLVAGGQAAQTGAQVDAQAEDVAAQSDLNSVLVAVKTLGVQTGSYAGVNPTALSSAEPGLCYVDASTSAVASGCGNGDGHSLSVYSGGSMFAAAAMSGSGTCFWVRDVLGSGTTYGSGDPCTGSAATAAAASAFPA